MPNNILAPTASAHINKSIKTAIFPDQLNMAKIYPIHKGGSKSDLTNYRPISILSNVSKIFEKHINNHLMAFLHKYELIHVSQSDFRQKNSCQTALVKLIDQRLTCIVKSGAFTEKLNVTLRFQFFCEQVPVTACEIYPRVTTSVWCECSSIRSMF